MNLREIPKPLVTRPWGHFKNLWGGDGYLLKRIRIHAGERLSLQRHRHRSEHWVVVEGNGVLRLNDSTLEAFPGVTLEIPAGALHRAQAGNKDLVIIEVQFGSLLSEEDIERLEDDYDRAAA